MDLTYLRGPKPGSAFWLGMQLT